MVEGARLESVYRGNSIQGSNPCLSAKAFSITYERLPFQRAIAGNELLYFPVWLNLYRRYRRHRFECEAGHREEWRSGEFEERRKGWRRCTCLIFMSGTLPRHFQT